MPESYCGDETDLIRYSGNSDSAPDFKNTISQIGSSPNMMPPMTPKSDVHVYVFYILYMGCYLAQGAGDMRQDSSLSFGHLKVKPANPS